METQKLTSAIESILFLNGEPIAVLRLAQSLEVSEEAIERGLEQLVKKYEAVESGLSLVRKGDQVQMVTKSDNTSFVEKFAKSAMQESLSKPALEVLAVIAYRGPIARAEIEAIRGVNCSVTLRNLLMRELIERKENENDARGYLYSVSFQFLREIGLQSISDLPEYESLSRDERLTAVLENQNIQQEQR